MTIVNMRKKFDEDRTCSSEDMIADAQRHTQADTPPTLLPHSLSAMMQKTRPLTYLCLTTVIFETLVLQV